MRHRSYTLECTPDTFVPRASVAGGLRISRATPEEAERCRRLWTEVGAGFWTERIRWSAARWRRQIQRPVVSFWIASTSSGEAGCFEHTRMRRGVRLEGFGLLPAHRGGGLGRDLLTAATLEAFATGARRVWLHTATDDHPHALPNYRAGGYRIVRERELRSPLLPRDDDLRPGE